MHGSANVTAGPHSPGYSRTAWNSMRHCQKGRLFAQLFPRSAAETATVSLHASRQGHMNSPGISSRFLFGGNLRIGINVASDITLGLIPPPHSVCLHLPPVRGISYWKPFKPAPASILSLLVDYLLTPPSWYTHTTALLTSTCPKLSVCNSNHMFPAVCPVPLPHQKHFGGSHEGDLLEGVSLGRYHQPQTQFASTT